MPPASNSLNNGHRPFRYVRWGCRCACSRRPPVPLQMCARSPSCTGSCAPEPGRYPCNPCYATPSAAVQAARLPPTCQSGRDCSPRCATEPAAPGETADVQAGTTPSWTSSCVATCAALADARTAPTLAGGKYVCESCAHAEVH